MFYFSYYIYIYHFILYTLYTQNMFYNGMNPVMRFMWPYCSPLGCIGASGGRPVGRRGFIAAFGKGLEGRAAGSQRFLSKKKDLKGIAWNCDN